MHIPPGSAMPSSRAATFTPSPSRSSFFTVFHHDVTQVDADPKQHAAMLGQRVVARLERVLDLDRAAHGLDDAGEFGKHRVARRTQDATVMEDDDSVDDRAVRGQHAHRALFVGGHLTAVADRVRSEDASQSTLDA